MKISQLRKECLIAPISSIDAIICRICGFDKAKLLLNLNAELSENELDEIEKSITRLKSGEPLQYILGVADFMGLEFYVTPDVLIPRFDTETIVEYCIKHIPQNSLFADICTGSGCIGVSILKNRPDLSCVFADISQDALKICKTNIEKHGVSDRAEIIKFDARKKDEYAHLGKISSLVSNPPYIKTSVIPSLEGDVLKEPYIALDGGDDGLDFYKDITEFSKCCFEERVHIIFEIGFDQKDGLYNIAKLHGMNFEIIKDLSDNDRCVILKK